MDLIQWKPFEDDLLEFPLSFRKFGGDLSVDLYEENGALVAKMNLPGITPEDVEVTLDKDVLTISGSRKEEEETTGKDYYSKEIRRGMFSRSVRLPKLVNTEEAEANYTDGVLTLIMPIVGGKGRGGVKVPIEYEAHSPG